MNEFLDYLSFQEARRLASRHVAVIPDEFLDAAKRHLALHKRPLLQVFLKPDLTFHVTGDDFSLQLHLGDPYLEPVIPTWREWIREHDNVPPSRIGKIRLMEDYGITRAELDDTMSEELFFQYSCRHDSPSSDAFDFLHEIGISEFHDEAGNTVGVLYLDDGVCPGNDSKIVTTDDYLSLSCLQHALEQRGHRCNFVIEE